MSKNKRFPLPKRFQASMSDKAYAQLRELNSLYGYGNNYLLTVLLENFDNLVDRKVLHKVFSDFADEYGAPPAGRKSSNS